MNFRSVIEPAEPADVLTSICRGEPIYIAGRSGKFEGLFTTPDFWAWADAGRREGSLFPRVFLTAYQLPLAFSREAIGRALRSGNTVCTSHVDKVSDVLRELCLDTEEVLGFPGTACVHCYYSPPGTGFSFFHMDSGVAITLQIEGTKTWKYALSPALPWTVRVGGYREAGHLDWFGDADWEPEPGSIPSPEAQGYVERTLHPGDVLVMPAGVWHSVSASDSTSVSLNLKLTASSALDGILDVVRQKCLPDVQWRGPLGFASRDETERGVPSPESLERLRGRLRGLMDIAQELLDDERELTRLWMRNFLGSQDDVRPGAASILTDHDVVRVPARLRPRVSVAPDGSVAVLGQGRILHLQGGAASDLLKQIFRERRFVVGKVGAWPSAAALSSTATRSVLQKLVETGFLAVDARP